MKNDQFYPITISVIEALRLSGLGRTKFYQLVKESQIQTTRVGSRRLVNFASLKAFLEQETGKC